jgi:hypothetical protein
MSLDVDIIPSTQEFFTWGELRDKLTNCQLDAGPRQLLGGNPQLADVGTKKIVDISERLTPYRFLYFKLAGDNTLGFDITSNGPKEKTYLDEQAYIDDYARNLSQEKKNDIASRWYEVGFGCSVITSGGRAKDEPPLFLAVAVAIAELCRGFVLVKDNGRFSLPVGCYTAEEFRDAKPLFSGRGAYSIRIGSISKDKPETSP